MSGFSRTAKFFSYAVWWVREPLMHAIVRARWQQIGDRVQLSRERVRQIECRAKEQLRPAVMLRARVN